MPKIRIHTTVSPETYKKIKDLKKEYRTLSAIIEEAIDALNNTKSEKKITSDDIILLSFVKELNFTLCAKDHYTGLAEGDTGKAVRESMLEMAIKYISKKPISELSPEEFLENVRKLWKILNRAEHAEVQNLGDRLNFVFYHDMRSFKVSEIHLNLIKHIYEKYYSMDYTMKVDTITVNGFSLIFEKRKDQGSGTIKSP
jgi:hypothetical protein